MTQIPRRSSFESVLPATEPRDLTERLSARLVSGVVDLLLVGTLTFAGFALVGPVSVPTMYRVTLPAGVGFLYGLRWLVRRGLVRPAALFLCVGGWLMVAS